MALHSISLVFLRLTLLAGANADIWLEREDLGTSLLLCPVPEFIDPVFAKTSPKRSFSVRENERFGLVFAKTGPIISGTGVGKETKMLVKIWHIPRYLLLYLKL